MQKHDIHERIFKFVVRGLRIIRYIPKSTESVIIINQYVRSLTSIGANDNEADGVNTIKDFIHCYTIVRKELKETYYWLKIISEFYQFITSINKEANFLINENDELIRIVSAIIQKSNKTKNNS